jgi:hypothetical protein
MQEGRESLTDRHEIRDSGVDVRDLGFGCGADGVAAL